MRQRQQPARQGRRHRRARPGDRGAPDELTADRTTERGRTARGGRRGRRAARVKGGAGEGRRG
ncbi:hypothetical protein ACFPM0_27340 [Pseudonocardia sulfidoxydans]|uniref:hypothetical protein n=1 Tax=Pseudonocardia sulfidoxydans TaxID=54011 RepID=UPI00361B77AA